MKKKDTAAQKTGEATAKAKTPQFNFKERLLIAFLSVFSFVFVTLIFGPIDIFANNMNEMTFSFIDFFSIIAAVSVGLTAALSLYYSAIRSTLFNVLTAVTFAIPVGGCLQLIIFGTTGEITGDMVTSDLKRKIIVSVFWVAVIAALVVASVVGKKKWKQISIFLAVLMLGMNGASLVTDFVTHDVTQSRGAKYEYVMTTDNILSLSDEENVVVLLVDRLDNVFVDRIFFEYPAFKEKIVNTLEGFTYYTDSTSLYGRTFPSVPYMITQEEYTGEKSPEDYLNTAYKQSRFLKDLKNNGYGLNIYIKDYYTYTDGAALLGVADNVAKTTGYTAKKLDVSSYLTCLSLARYMPQSLEALSYMFTNNAFGALAVRVECGEHESYYADDAALYARLCENGLSVNEDMGKNYTFLHLEGAHAPYDLTADCKASKKETDPCQQSMGSLTFVMEYLNRMKEIGVYDNSTVIIVADHGYPVNDLSDKMEEGVTCALFIKPRNSDRQPMKYSSAQVSHTNLFAAVVQDANIETDNDYGVSVFDIPEGVQTVRRYEKFVYANSTCALNLSEYEIKGDASKFENWKYIKTTDTGWEWY